MATRKLKFAVIDAETDPFHNCLDINCPKCAGLGRKPRPFIWGLYDGDQFLTFDSTDELLKYLESVKTPMRIYAHNGGRFDYHFIRAHINADEPVMMIDGRMAKFRVGIHEFRDSVNLMTAPLSEIGNKREIDYESMEPDRRTDPNIRAEIIRYLRADCVELWLALERYFKEFGQGLTQAGSALKFWSKMTSIEPPRQTRQLHDRYRPYYYGGRVQCFASGHRKTNFKVADINSAYPFAMKKPHIFSPEGRVQTHAPPDRALERCLIRLRCQSIGAFPYRTPDGELDFPDDEKIREYTVTGWEFLQALQMNALNHITVKEYHYFGEVTDFDAYVEKFYQARQHAKSIGDKAGDLFAKIYMNALYGKFGASPSYTLLGADGKPLDKRFSNYREYVIATSDTVGTWLQGIDPTTGQPLDGEPFTHHIQPDHEGADAWGDRILLERPLPEKREKFYNVATAASVTGWVRAYMFDSLYKCGGQLYCDTDSIAAEDVSGLSLGPALGQWKIEMECDEYAIAGKKLYAFHNSRRPYDQGKNQEWKIASKGVGNCHPYIKRDGHYERIDGRAQAIIAVANGDTVRFVPQAPTYSISRAAPRFVSRDVTLTV